MTDARSDELIDVLLDTPDMAVFLQQLVELSSRELGQPHCSITVWRKRRPVTVNSTDPQTAALDEIQYGFKKGPCLEALHSQQVVEVVDFRSETRWPEYVRAMADNPIRSVLAVPIALKSEGAAALNCYSESPGPIPDEARAALLAFTSTAARAVSLSVKMQAQEEKSADLEAALESRTAIDLAAGVIMAQTGCSQEQAVDILVKASNNRNEKLRDVALSVLQRFNGTTPSTHFDNPSLIRRRQA
ncbi:GAF and ANTAR domain-containing protein [Arthrobacter sp. AD-310]